MGLNYEIQYHKGIDNKVDDVLSRCVTNADSARCAAITTIVPLWVQKVEASYKCDYFFSKILSAKLVDPTTYPDFTLEQGLIRYKGRLAVGYDAVMRAKILAEMHDFSYGGHSGILGTYMRVKPIFYWPQLRGDMEKLVQSYDICQRTKKS